MTRAAEPSADRSCVLPDPRGGVNAVEVAGLLLRLLSEAPGPMRLADLSRAAVMPTAKAHRYLVSLVRAGLVEQDAASSRYGLGPLMVRAGIEALARSDLLDRSERVLRRIAERTGETAAVVVWGSHGPTHVRLAGAHHALAASVAPGHVCPLTFSASGLVFCTWEKPERVRPLAEAEMEQGRAMRRPGVPRTLAELDRLAERCRALGFAATANEGDTGLSAVSVPVFDPSGSRLLLAITVFARIGRLDVAADGPVVALMREAAGELGARLHASR